MVMLVVESEVVASRAHEPCTSVVYVSFRAPLGRWMGDACWVAGPGLGPASVFISRRSVQQAAGANSLPSG